jgi:hypothetical protein
MHLLSEFAPSTRLNYDSKVDCKMVVEVPAVAALSRTIFRGAVLTWTSCSLPHTQ